MISVASAAQTLLRPLAHTKRQLFSMAYSTAASLRVTVEPVQQIAMAGPVDGMPSPVERSTARTVLAAAERLGDERPVHNHGSFQPMCRRVALARETGLCIDGVPKLRSFRERGASCSCHFGHFGLREASCLTLATSRHTAPLPGSAQPSCA